MSLRSIYKSYKVEIKPTSKQKEILNKNLGCVRYTYNWCVNKFIENKDKKIQFNIFDYIKEFTRFKNNTEEAKFLVEDVISSNALQQSILDFGKSAKSFFKNKYGFPQFKKKGICKDSYREYNYNIQSSEDRKGSLRICERKIQIPRLGWTKIKGKPEKYLPSNKIISNITLFKDIDKYYISIYYKNDIFITDDDVEKRNPQFGVIGIDLGIKK